MRRDRVPFWAIAIAVVVLLLVPGAAAVTALAVRWTEERRRVRRELAAAARRYKIDPELVQALAGVESRWTLTPPNMTGADGARGGAWGPTQITERTARAHGYTGPMEAMTRDTALAADWTARILAARPGGPPRTIEDAAAWWNAGRSSFASLPADHVTRLDYTPKARAALAAVRADPLVA